MKTFSKDRFITSFSSSNAPAYKVDLEEVFMVETDDCYGGAITSSKHLRTEVNIDFINPATGPIYINELRKGDTLCVEILDIELNDQGIMALYPGMGALGDMVQETDTRIIPVKDGLVQFNQHLKFQVNPMIGVLGVAPEIGEVLCETPGDHGGNMDTKFLTKGNKIYLPVFHDGGLLALGDLHASMGDGELNGSGIEIGGKVKMMISKSRNVETFVPIIETNDKYMYVVSDRTLEDASRRGMQIVVESIQKQRNLSFNDAYRLLSATCDLQISQIVNPLVTIRISVPKFLLD